MTTALKKPEKNTSASQMHEGASFLTDLSYNCQIIPWTRNPGKNIYPRCNRFVLFCLSYSLGETNDKRCMLAWGWQTERLSEEGHHLRTFQDPLSQTFHISPPLVLSALYENSSCFFPFPYLLFCSSAGSPAPHAPPRKPSRSIKVTHSSAQQRREETPGMLGEPPPTAPTTPETVAEILEH